MRAVDSDTQHPYYLTNRMIDCLPRKRRESTQQTEETSLISNKRTDISVVFGNHLREGLSSIGLNRATLKEMQTNLQESVTDMAKKRKSTWGARILGGLAAFGGFLGGLVVSPIKGALWLGSHFHAPGVVIGAVGGLVAAPVVAGMMAYESYNGVVTTLNSKDILNEIPADTRPVSLLPFHTDDDSHHPISVPRADASVSVNADMYRQIVGAENVHQNQRAQTSQQADKAKGVVSADLESLPISTQGRQVIRESASGRPSFHSQSYGTQPAVFSNPMHRV